MIITRVFRYGHSVFDSLYDKLQNFLLSGIAGTPSTDSGSPVLRIVSELATVSIFITGPVK